MLTERQRKFVDAYRGNGLAAARAAGYTGSDATVKVRASKLLKHPAVIAALEDRQAGVEAAIDKPTPPELEQEPAAFVDAYLRLGDAAKAARSIGYRGANASDFGRRMLARADVHDAVEAKRAEQEAAAIAHSREQQRILSELARSKEIAPKDRVAAISTLHKIQGAPAPRAAGDVPSKPAPPKLKLLNNGRGPTKATG